MPLAGSAKSWTEAVQDPVDPPYFSALKDLDTWAKNPRKKFDGVLEYKPRPEPTPPSDIGKLLVQPKS
jgi:hypothetical protein